MAVKYCIVMSSDIAKCPQQRLDPQHWIPRHKTAQCGGRKAWRKKSQPKG